MMKALTLLRRLTQQSAEVFGSDSAQGTAPHILLRPMAEAASQFRAARTSDLAPRSHTLEAAKERWSRSGYRLDTSFPLREIRALCSEYTFLTNERFLEALRGRHDCLQRRSCVESLIRTYFANWTPDSGLVPIEAFLRRTVTGFPGTGPRIDRCKQAPDKIFSRDAAQWLAESAVRDWIPVVHFLSQWGISPGTGLGVYTCNLVPQEVAERLQRRVDTTEDRSLKTAVDYFSDHLVGVEHVTPTRLAPLAITLIRTVEGDTDLPAKDRLKHCFVSSSRYGDPRLWANDARWAYLGEESRTIVSGWLSEASLEFFFQQVLPDRKDPHGRREFWRSYLGEVSDCLVVLSSDDERRLRDRLDPDVVFGTMEGSSDTSAFLMKFKGSTNVLVVEFSRTGNAIQIHDDGRFTQATGGGLRRPGLTFHHTRDLKRPRTLVEKLSHRAHWQFKARSVLASYGIRPR